MAARFSLVIAGLVLFAGPLAAQTPNGSDVAMAASEVEERPVMVPGSCRPPTYPPTMRAAGIEGRVTLQFVVDTLGRVEPGSIRALSSTHSWFEDAARRAVTSCRYRPARANGRAVRAMVQSPFTFQLERS